MILIVVVPIMIRHLSTALLLVAAAVPSGAAGAEPLIIAHRGASAAAPENTMAAFELAWELGADGIEGDFRLTKDGVIVAVHDKNTKRVTGGKSELVVADTGFAELAALDVGSWKGAGYEGERVPTLAQVLDALPAGKRFFIEIKCGTEIMPAFEKVLGEAIRKRPRLPAQLTIISFNAELVAVCRERFPQIPANYLKSYQQNEKTLEWTPGFDKVLAQLRACRASGLGTQANAEVVTPDFVRGLRAAGIEFHCWTVNEPKLARQFAELGVDSITTDKPKAIRTALAAEPAAP